MPTFINIQKYVENQNNCKIKKCSIWLGWGILVSNYLFQKPRYWASKILSSYTGSKWYCWTSASTCCWDRTHTYLLNLMFLYIIGIMLLKGQFVWLIGCHPPTPNCYRFILCTKRYPITSSWKSLEALSFPTFVHTIGTKWTFGHVHVFFWGIALNIMAIFAWIKHPKEYMRLAMHNLMRSFFHIRSSRI